MKHGKIWMFLLGGGSLALSSSVCTRPSHAAAWSAPSPYEACQTPILLVDNGPILPSQRPRYLSGSASSTSSRFSPSSGTNPWGLGPITPDEGIVTLKPGETDRTAAMSDLGARVAGATYGHPDTSGAAGMAK